jgi:polyisoprenoid-binding protein YceI
MRSARLLTRSLPFTPAQAEIMRSTRLFLGRAFAALLPIFLFAAPALCQDAEAPLAPEIVEEIAAPSPKTMEFRIVKGGEENVVCFESRATMECFDGRSKSVWGSLSLDPAALGDSLSMLIEVDVTAFDTGIKLRNQHMRENHLHTDKYPRSTFRAGKIIQGKETSLLDGAAHEILLEGDLELHGVHRAIQAPVKMTYSNSPPEIRLETTFLIKLSDFEIPRPQMLFMKLSEVQKVTATLVASAADAPTP